MASLRNQHLKVYNLFNRGIQNIPATHLINDTAFYKGIGYNIEDSTIKPIKGNASYTDIPIRELPIQNPSKYIIKENLQGKDVITHFANKISFVNYADTVYYLNDTDEGSPLFKIYNDISNTPHKGRAFLHNDISDLTVTTNSSWQSKVEVVKDQVKQSETVLKREFTIHNVGRYYNTTQLLNSELPLGNDYLYLTAYNLSANADIQRTVDFLDDKVATLKKDLQQVLEETQGDLRERVKQAVASSAKLSVFIRNNEEDKATHKNIYGDWHDNEFGYSANIDGWQDVVGMFIVRNKVNLINLFTDIEKYSIFKYIPIQMNQDPNHWENNWRGVVHLPPINYVSLHEWVKQARQSIIYANIPDNIQNMEYSDRSEAKYQEARDYLGDRAIRDIAVLFQVLEPFNLWDTSSDTFSAYPDNSHLKIFGRRATLGNQLLPSINLAQLTPYFTSLHDSVKKALDSLDSLNVRELFKGLSEIYIVKHNKYSNAISAPYKAGKYYLADGFTIDFNYEHETEYLIYANVAGGAEPTLIATKDNADPLTVNAPLPVNGAVMESPNQLVTPHNDYSIIQVYNGSMFLNRKNSQEIWFTEPNSPHIMTSTSFIKTSQPVKAMKTAGAGLFIWTTNNDLYLLTGSVRDSQGKNTLSLKLIGERVNIFNKNSVISQDNLVVWLSSYGIHNTSGYGSATPTEYMWRPEYPITDVLQSIIYRGTIYFLVDMPTRKLIYFDTHRKAINEADTTGVNSLTVIDDKLIGIYDEELREMFADDVNVGTYDVTLKTFGGYSYDTRLRFNSLQVAHSAKPYSTFNKDYTTTVSVYIDDFLVGSWDIQGTDSSRIPLPNPNNTGQAITIRLKGKLNIKSIRLRYTPKDWED